MADAVVHITSKTQLDELLKSSPILIVECEPPPTMRHSPPCLGRHWMESHPLCLAEDAAEAYVLTLPLS